MGQWDAGGLVGVNYGNVANCYSTATVKVPGQWWGGGGGLVGANSGRLTNCYSTGMVSGEGNVGGLVGFNSGTVNQCYSTGAVSGTGAVGGLAGSNSGTVTQCYSSGVVSGKSVVGGLVGANGGYVTDCYSTGQADANDVVGGLAGRNWGGISLCYSTGPVTGNANVGGLVGVNRMFETELIGRWIVGRATMCFWDVQTSGQATSDGGMGRTTPEMLTVKTFLDASWDFVGETANGSEDIWWILDGAYYPLLWELTPPHAWSPYPVDGAIDVEQGAILTWLPTRSGTEYDVYLGEDASAVDSATVGSPGVHRGRLGGIAYDPAGLEWGKTYYWRIDHIGTSTPQSPSKGSVWSFTTADSITVSVVDDFESYTNEGNLIFRTWIDGYYEDANNPGNGTGSYVGNEKLPFAEQTIVHGGKQSMPMDYNNVKKPYYSEAQRTYATAQDWTVGGADTLTLYFRGKADNAKEPLYVGIEDGGGRMAVVVHPDAKAVLATEWQKWHIAFADVHAAGVDVAAVKRMVIGVGDRKNPKPGGTGRIYIDDIRLTRRVP